MVRQLARPTVQPQASAPPPLPQPKNLREWLAANPQVIKIVAAAMAGAIVASILPHISWILGAVVGGALMLGKLKKG